MTDEAKARQAKARHMTAQAEQTSQQTDRLDSFRAVHCIIYRWGELNGVAARRAAILGRPGLDWCWLNFMLPKRTTSFPPSGPILRGYRTCT